MNGVWSRKFEEFSTRVSIQKHIVFFCDWIIGVRILKTRSVPKWLPKEKLRKLIFLSEMILPCLIYIRSHMNHWLRVFGWEGVPALKGVSGKIMYGKKKTKWREWRKKHKDVLILTRKIKQDPEIGFFRSLICNVPLDSEFDSQWRPKSKFYCGKSRTWLNFWKHAAQFTPISIPCLICFCL